MGYTPSHQKEFATTSKVANLREFTVIDTKQSVVAKICIKYFKISDLCVGQPLIILRAIAPPANEVAIAASAALLVKDLIDILFLHIILNHDWARLCMSAGRE